MSGMEPVAATNPAGASAPPITGDAVTTSRSAAPAKQPSEISRPVAPVAAAPDLGNKEALSGDISGMFMSIFGGKVEGLDFGKGVTLEQLQKAGSSVKKEFFDLIANGMKTKDEGQGSDTLITTDEVQEFFKNVDQFRQMAQLPEGDIGKVAQLYNEEGVKFTRVDASQIKQMSDAVKQKWGTLSAETDPYKRLLKTIGNKPDITDDEAKGFAASVDALSNKIIGKDFKTASEEERMKMIDAYVFMQWAMQEKIDVEKLYGSGNSSMEDLSLLAQQGNKTADGVSGQSVDVSNISPEECYQQAKQIEKEFGDMKNLTKELEQAAVALKPWVQTDASGRIPQTPVLLTPGKGDQELDKYKALVSRYQEISGKAKEKAPILRQLYGKAASSADPKIKNDSALQLGRFEDVLNDPSANDYFKAQAYMGKAMLSISSGGDIQAANQLLEKAKTMLESYVKSNPSDEDAKKMLADINGQERPSLDSGAALRPGSQNTDESILGAMGVLIPIEQLPASNLTEKNVKELLQAINGLNDQQYESFSKAAGEYLGKLQNTALYESCIKGKTKEQAVAELNKKMSALAPTPATPAPTPATPAPTPATPAPTPATPAPTPATPAPTPATPAPTPATPAPTPATPAPTPATPAPTPATPAPTPATPAPTPVVEPGFMNGLRRQLDQVATNFKDGWQARIPQIITTYQSLQILIGSISDASQYPSIQKEFESRAVALGDPSDEPGKMLKDLYSKLSSARDANGATEEIARLIVDLKKV